LNNILKYIREFYLKEFNGYYFFAILLMVGILIYLNYWHSLEIKCTQGNTWGKRFWGQYLMYLIPFSLAFFLQPVFLRHCTYFNNGWFWAILFMAPAIFSLKMNFDFHQAWLSRKFSGDELYFIYRCSSFVIRGILCLIPVFIIWYVKDRNTMSFYGSAAMGNIKPYLLMLLIMVPLIAMASTQQDFLHMYPRAKFLLALNLENKGPRIVLYELCYGLDFITIEFFFRGFLVLALLKICGMHAILPAAVFYCTIHFGKPLGEAISSFWGGLLLGIVSFHNFSIWGGLIAHLGIAWMMEIGGWVGGLLKFSK
jgi:hypothetical protein